MTILWERTYPAFDYAFSPAHNRTYRIVRCQTCTHVFSIVPHKNLWENYQSVIDNEYLKRQDERLMTSHNVVNILRKIAPLRKITRCRVCHR